MSWYNEKPTGDMPGSMPGTMPGMTESNATAMPSGSMSTVGGGNSGQMLMLLVAAGAGIALAGLAVVLLRRKRA